jgi:predicted enzyme related to lactoylglutathione lyase
MNPITAGTFCWNEMVTRDIKTASDFYCTLFGWEATKDDCCGMDYTVFKKDGHSVGGMMLMDDNWPAETPSHWGSYIAVDDVDAMSEKVSACGGTLCCGPQDAGEEGRFAVMSDPTGATVSIFKGEDGKNPVGPGSFCWNELVTTDMDAAGAFYEKMFGWKAEVSQTGEEPYAIFMHGESWAGGMMKMHWVGKPSWLGYVCVADVDMTTSKAVELGSQVCVEPAEIPGIGRFAVFTDPVGATIAVFTGSEEGCENDCNCS